ncbi:MAG: T9SS type A sorting domain-containing protein, partial [Flavobacteriales bacterium]|nr:T9SS type A sorting domain-containing protein [Flavobacteriales bacterium]
AAWFSHHGSGTNANLFTAGSTDPGNGSWLWEFGDGTTSTDPAPGHTWALPGPHFVSLTRQMAGCTSTYGRWVEVDGNGTTCGPGLFADFVPQFNGPLTTFTPSLVSTGITPMLGIWSYGDGTIDTAMVGSHVYEEAWGSYQVCMLVGALAQASLDTCFSLVCRTIDLYSMAGVGEVSRMALGAWPNPADGVVHLRWPGPSTQATIRWYDMLGRPVKEWTQVLEPTTTLRSDDLPDGLYVLEVIAAQERYTQRLRIAH